MTIELSESDTATTEEIIVVNGTIKCGNCGVPMLVQFDRCRKCGWLNPLKHAEKEAEKQRRQTEDD